jgi:hypothetical protein
LETQLQYGRGELSVEVPSSDVTVLRTKHEEELPEPLLDIELSLTSECGSLRRVMFNVRCLRFLTTLTSSPTYQKHR